jgi:tRNA (guanosine-2'-O-)-methyltransferase
MNMSKTKQEEIAYLNSLVTENKRNKIEQVLDYRTRYVTVALENIEQPHNASAVIRSCDIFGVQDLHVIEEEHRFTPQNSIAKGAVKWIDTYHYTSTTQCITTLKKEGYSIVATTPHSRGYSLSQLPLYQKVAFLFGTEATGLSQEALDAADEYVTIPMFGFTESFNISVSVSLCLYDIISRLHQSKIHWQLPKDERENLQLKWLKKILHMTRAH